MYKLDSARYGKDNVRVYKVDRDEKTGFHTVYEMTIRVMLEGDIDTSYTKADNSVVITTDTMKNTIYILAKKNSVSPPELFASIVGTHFIETYSHIHTATVTIVCHRWTRLIIDGKPHSHSFIRDGTETRNLECIVREGNGISLSSAIAGLLVLKSTGSQFHGYVKDEYTTLPETWDRVLSTEIDCSWGWKEFSGLDAVRKEAPVFDAAWQSARNITLKTFAEENSNSVQDTTFRMAGLILDAVPLAEAVSYSLPNKHYFEINLSWHKGIKNTGENAEVEAPQWGPNGLIQCTVRRDGKSRL